MYCAKNSGFNSFILKFFFREKWPKVEKNNFFWDKNWPSIVFWYQKISWLSKKWRLLHSTLYWNFFARITFLKIECQMALTGCTAKCCKFHQWLRNDFFYMVVGKNFVLSHSDCLAFWINYFTYFVEMSYRWPWWSGKSIFIFIFFPHWKSDFFPSL